MAEQEIYFDNSATTQVESSVAEAVYRVMVEDYGNPSSLHQKGMAAERLLKEARRQVAKSIGAKEQEIYFTSGGTESDNLAILGLAQAYKNKGKHIITTAIEHPAVLQPVRMLQEQGYAVDLLPVDVRGCVRLEDVAACLRPDTLLVSVMMVNNEVGSIQPIAEIGHLLRQQKQRVYFHVDAVQAYGKLPLSPKAWGVDLLSASGHKIQGPKGIGFLYVAEGVRLLPILGGGGQENNLRSGTENLPGIVGLAEASKLATAGMEEHRQQVEAVRSAFLAGLQQLSGWQVNGDLAAALPYVLNLRFDGVKSEVLLHMLETRGLFVSAGSACSAKKKENLSPVLQAMGLPKQAIEGSLRFSFSAQNTVAEAERAATILCQEVESLRKILRG